MARHLPISISSRCFWKILFFFSASGASSICCKSFFSSWLGIYSAFVLFLFFCSFFHGNHLVQMCFLSVAFGSSFFRSFLIYLSVKSNFIIWTVLFCLYYWTLCRYMVILLKVFYFIISSLLCMTFLERCSSYFFISTFLMFLHAIFFVFVAVFSFSIKVISFVSASASISTKTYISTLDPA